MIVPTLCVGTHPVTLRVTTPQAATFAPSVGRGASERAFPRLSLIHIYTTDPLRNQVAAQWPQANGSLGRLYAMGVDAYRLAPRLGQLKALPDTRVDGLSGNLGISANQRVDRQMPWAKFVGGDIQRLPDTPR